MKTDPNLRKYQLSFCTVCTNKEINFKEGTICSLTKQKADFIKECENYSENEKLTQERIEKVKQKIYEKYPKQNLANKIFSSQFYKSSSEIKAKRVEKTNIKNTKYDSTHFKVLFFIMLIFFFYLVVTKFDKLLEIENNQNEIYNFGFHLIFIGILYYAGFIKKYKKDTIKIDDFGIHFRQSEYGIKYENKTVKWNEILEYGILTIPHKNLYSYNIILGTKTLEILKMDVTSMEITPEEYIGIINEKLKNVA
ncbi:hypothetical protein [Flavicella marina]|uniref:hypothetical protein n=1 Tax=Flavicella marina TaxID=1475951 RepID=UPI001264C9DD|nr:hypothetical protein [Flavicella marina]